MGTLTQATRLCGNKEGFVVDLDPAWEGWGPAGGYLAAIALRTVGSVIPQGHRPVTLTAQFLGKASSGTADVQGVVLKPGGSSLIVVTLSQSGRCFFQAQIWTTSRTVGPQISRISMPIVSPPQKLEPLEAHFSRHGLKPVTFWSNLDCRPIEFRVPGGPTPRTDRLERWYRFRDETRPLDVFDCAARAAVLIDANIWAAHWRMLESDPSYAGPSLDLTIWFHDLEDYSDWLLLDAASPTSVSGIVHGTGNVWTSNGKLIASGGGNCLVVPFAMPVN